MSTSHTGLLFKWQMTHTKDNRLLLQFVWSQLWLTDPNTAPERTWPKLNMCESRTSSNLLKMMTFLWLDVELDWVRLRFVELVELDWGLVKLGACELSAALRTCSCTRSLPALRPGSRCRTRDWRPRLLRRSHLDEGIQTTLVINAHQRSLSRHKKAYRPVFPPDLMTYFLKGLDSAAVEQVGSLQDVPVPDEGFFVLPVQEGLCGLIQWTVLHHLQPPTVVPAELLVLDLLPPLLVQFLQRCWRAARFGWREKQRKRHIFVLLLWSHLCFESLTL